MTIPPGHYFSLYYARRNNIIHKIAAPGKYKPGDGKVLDINEKYGNRSKNKPLLRHPNVFTKAVFLGLYRF